MAAIRRLFLILQFDFQSGHALVHLRDIDMGMLKLVQHPQNFVVRTSVQKFATEVAG